MISLSYNILDPLKTTVLNDVDNSIYPIVVYALGAARVFCSILVFVDIGINCNMLLPPFLVGGGELASSPSQSINTPP